MCLLTFMPEDVMPDMARFKEAAIQNADGFGFAILESKGFVKAHSMNFNEIANKFSDARDKHKGPAIFHFRWATHGSETVDNCHPFTLGDDPTSVMGHNGILDVQIPKGDKRSDTKVFAEDIMPAIGGITSLDDTEYFDKMETWAGGNKLVFLTHHDDAKYNWYILNSHLGHWDQEMWWSNSSYKKYEGIKYTTRAATMYDYNSIGLYEEDDYGYEYTGYYDRSLYRWDYENRRYVSTVTGDDMESISNTYDDEAELLIDEEENMLASINAKLKVFTTQIDNKTNLIECYACGNEEYRPSDEITIECAFCTACLHCAHYGGCQCWTDLEKFYTNEIHNETTYTTNTKELSK